MDKKIPCIPNRSGLHPNDCKLGFQKGMIFFQNVNIIQDFPFSVVSLADLFALLFEF